jgi:hypothetical protein
MINFDKICINLFYGQDILNEEEYFKLSITDISQTLSNYLKSNFINRWTKRERMNSCILI